MISAADIGPHSSRATPSLRDAQYRQFNEQPGRRSTYPAPIAVQTNRATSIRLYAGRPNSIRSTWIRTRHDYIIINDLCPREGWIRVAFPPPITQKFVTTRSTTHDFHTKWLRNEIRQAPANIAELRLVADLPCLRDDTGADVALIRDR